MKNSIHTSLLAAAICLLSIFLAPGTHAGVQHLYLTGDCSARKIVAKNDLQVPCDLNCKQMATLSELSQTSATVNCGVCTLTGDREFAGQTVASAKASATASLSRSFSDTTQTAKFTASGEADLFVSPIENAAGRFFLKADLEADGGVTFEVFDHAETITINKSVSGSGLGTAGIVLIGPGGEV